MPVALRPPLMYSSHDGGSPGAARTPKRVDGCYDALRAEALGALVDDFRRIYMGRVDRDLVGTGLENVAHVREGANPAADHQGNEDPLGDLAHEVHDNGAAIG